MQPLLADDAAGIAHLIQTALTPVFLLSGIGVLLNLFNTRLARVADELIHVADLRNGDIAPTDDARLARHMRRLGHRMWLLDVSILFGAIGGASTCAAAFVLFLGSLRQAAVAGALIGTFALALFCTVMALIVFLCDSLIAWHGLREEGPLPRRVREAQ
jgi:hypothetical protein